MDGILVGFSIICITTAVAADDRVVTRKTWMTWKAK